MQTVLKWLVAVGLAALPVAGCGSEDSKNGSGGAAGSAGAAGAPGGCRSPASADRARKVVISHPYNADSTPSGDYEVLELSKDGALTSTGAHFEMTRAVYGEIAFTPDGNVGLVADDDGNLDVFRFDESGATTVVHGPYQGQFYAQHVVLSGDGNTVYVLDSQWRENGGGVYALDLACDGTLSNERKLADSKLPYAMVLLDDGRALVAAEDMLTSDASHELFLMNWDPAATLVSGSPAFGDHDAIIASMTLTADGRFVVLGDNNEYSGTGNRLALVELSGDTLSARQVLTNVEDPVDLVASPYGSSAIAVSGYGDAIFELAIDPNAASLSLVGELAYAGAGPQLPSGAVMVERGGLTGRVLIAENTAVRQVQFDPDGSVRDVGPTDLGSGVEVIPGVIGVQP